MKTARRRFERDFIAGVLSATDWNMSRAARVLGIERSHLYRLVKLHGIHRGA